MGINDEGRAYVITIEQVFDKAMESQCSCAICRDIKALVWRQIKAERTLKKYDLIWTQKEKEQLTQSAINFNLEKEKENLEKS